MWQHWNSFWAPGPGDPPAVDDPVLWQAPWSTEQAIALQTRQWDALLSASHSWWTMLLSAWPVAPAWPLPGWPAPAPLSPAAATGIEPLVTGPKATPRAAAPRKRAAARKR
jgi:hypothetical protein